MHGTLLDRLESSGYAGRIVSVGRLAELQAAVEAQHRQGLLDEEFYQERLTFFQFYPPDDLPEARSLIVVTFRDPLMRFGFHWQGRVVAADVPPTYIHGAQKRKRAAELLSGVLAESGHRLVPALVPQKLLTACSGLGRYGRNNITYVPGMGSYQRPAAFFSDLPCEADEWGEPQTLERCDRCTACARACPSGAIAADRFLLHAERCLTYWNEKPPAVAFPAWIDPGWHNCLVGCMHCQAACPENRGLLERQENGIEFSEEETGLLLAGLAPADLPAELVDKLREWDLLDMADTLPRNLGVLVEGTE
jgi:epoxyqueuosine reductase